MRGAAGRRGNKVRSPDTAATFEDDAYYGFSLGIRALFTHVDMP
jgi:hypothetical protein